MLSHHYQNPGLPYQRENIVEQKEYVGKSETLLITLHSAESCPWCFGFDGSQTMSDAPAATESFAKRLWFSHDWCLFNTSKATETKNNCQDLCVT